VELLLLVDVVIRYLDMPHIEVYMFHDNYVSFSIMTMKQTKERTHDKHDNVIGRKAVLLNINYSEQYSIA
jgi:hypothetical protein